jgi:cytoskeleton protein RodZ
MALEAEETAVMSSIGETLRRERLKRNLDLDQVSRELKISPKLLDAIEADQFEKLPGTMFAKSFVRQYAHLLSLDEDEMAGEVQRVLQPPVEVPRFADTHKPAPIPIQVPRVEAWETVGDRSFSWGSPLPALALCVVAMLACSGIYAWYQRRSHPVLAQNNAATEPARPVPQQTTAVAQTPSATPREAAPPVITAEQPAAKVPEQQPQQQAATQPQVKPTPAPLVSPNPPAAVPAATAPSVPAPLPNAAVRVQITAEEASWVLARADGKYVFSGTLDANQTRTVEGMKNIELRLGNAGGINIVLNGNSLGAVGPKGQVRTVQFTSGGFQIVPAPKSAPLETPR